MLDGLFNGLSFIGQKITEWGGKFIDGVKDFLASIPHLLNSRTWADT